jgi:hypothetical protein
VRLAALAFHGLLAATLGLYLVFWTQWVSRGGWGGGGAGGAAIMEGVEGVEEGAGTACCGASPHPSRFHTPRAHSRSRCTAQTNHRKPVFW